jgi:hypothetical protein
LISNFFLISNFCFGFSFILNNFVTNSQAGLHLSRPDG